jgi:Phage T4 tail fibre
MIHNPFFTILNPHLSLGKSMKRISLLLMAVIGCQAADVVADTLTVNAYANVSGYLNVNRSTANGTLSASAFNVIRATGTAQSVTSYDKAIFSFLGEYAIPSGVVDSGYKIGVDASAYSSSPVFNGTLNSSFGLWARAGIHQSGASARILAAYGVYAELLSNAGTINDGFGVYIKTDGYSPGVVTNRYDLYAASPTAKNYFAGNVGVGTTTPARKLHIYSPNGMAFKAEASGNAVLEVQGNDVGSQTAINFCNSVGSSDGQIAYFPNGSRSMTFNTQATERLRIDSTGNVGIGTTTPTNKLTVIGTISAKEVKVTTTGADYVFENDYKLRPLAEVEAFIAEHKHLPEMMSAKAMQADGMPVSEVVTKQLAKIEELTLYAIKSERERQAQADRLALLEKQSERLAVLEKQIANVTALNAQLSENMQLLLKRVEQDGARK